MDMSYLIEFLNNDPIVRPFFEAGNRLSVEEFRSYIRALEAIVNPLYRPLERRVEFSVEDPKASHGFIDGIIRHTDNSLNGSFEEISKSYNRFREGSGFRILNGAALFPAYGVMEFECVGRYMEDRREGKRIDPGQP